MTNLQKDGKLAEEVYLKLWSAMREFAEKDFISISEGMALFFMSVHSRHDVKPAEFDLYLHTISSSYKRIEAELDEK
jgi:hypothetical protein